MLIIIKIVKEYGQISAVKAKYLRRQISNKMLQTKPGYGN
jgi:intergrase/recombinase